MRCSSLLKSEKDRQTRETNMSTEFPSPEEAKRYVAACCELDPAKVVFEEVPDLKVGGVETVLLDDPSISEVIKKSIRDRIAAQQAFKFKTPKGDVTIVIGPFRSGFDCWVVGDKGYATRL
jgi:hypothetical protein